ncbi:hypothetical protein BsWGS_25332 [Bradybaena similaris]
MFLLLHILPSCVFSHPVYLNITNPRGNRITVGLGGKNETRFGDTFVNCICGLNEACEMPVAKLKNFTGTRSQALPAECVASYKRETFFICRYSQMKVYCTKDEASSCPSASCTINIIISCNNELPFSSNVVVTWISDQIPSVLMYTDEVPVIDCCPTTTEVITISTTPTFTSLTSANPTRNNFGCLTSTSPSPDNTTIDNSNQQKGDNTSSLISGPFIGIIVGAAVAAILITIAIICIFRKLKTRRKRKRRNRNAEIAMPASRKLDEREIPELTPVSDAHMKVSKTVARVSPFETDCHLTPAAENYTYIDVNPSASCKTNMALKYPSSAVEEPYQNSTTASCKTNMALKYPSSAVEEPYQNCTTAEAEARIQDGEYSHLGAEIVRLENPYNWSYLQNNSTGIQPVNTPMIQTDKQPLENYLQSSHIGPTNYHVVDGIEQSNGNSEHCNVYSKLGESNVLPENTYNSLHSLNDEPITEVTLHIGPTNQNSGIRAETIPSANHKLQLFPGTSKHKSVDIVDVTSYN